MEVYKITIEQKEALIGQTYDDVQYFNPMLDADNNWFISIEEVNNCTNESFQWVKDLPLIEYNPVVSSFFLNNNKQ
jgi:hypothetical protein